MDTVGRSKEQLFSTAQREVQSWHTRNRIELQRAIDAIKNYEDLTKAAEEFSYLFVDTLTDPEFNIEDNKFIAAFLFEQSFFYFTKDNKEGDGNIAGTNESLLDNLLVILEQAREVDETMYYTLMGELAYHLQAHNQDTRSIYSAEELQDIYDALQDAIQKKIAQINFQEQSTEHAKLLQTVEAITHRDFSSLPDADPIEYYASLYAHDTSKVEDIIDTNNIHIFEQNLQSGKPRIEQGIPTPSHTRLFTFTENRLPTPKTISENRVTLYIQETIGTKGSKQEAYLYQLPDSFIEIYTTYLRDKRSLSEYKNADEEERKELRKKYLSELISDIVKGGGELMTAVQKNMAADEVNRLREQLKKWMMHLIHLLLQQQLILISNVKKVN